MLDPSKANKGDLFAADYALLGDLLQQALAAETQTPLFDAVEIEDHWEMALSAQGLMHAARLLDQRYHLVITNVPYLARGKQEQALKDYCEQQYPDAKNDLANVFLERCLELTVASCGVVQIVMPQNWLFLGGYKKQREDLLKRVRWDLMARLGEGGFDSPQAAGAFIILLTQTNISGHEKFQMYGIDASIPKLVMEKAEILRLGELTSVIQKGQLDNPDARITMGAPESGDILNKYASTVEGLCTGDNPQFVFAFWEQPAKPKSWEWFIQKVDETTHYGGRSDVLKWDDGHGALQSHPSAHNFPSQIMNGRQILGKAGIRVAQMRALPCTLYGGEIFGNSGGTLVPHDPEHLSAIWSFCSSIEYAEGVRRIDQKLNVTISTLAKVSFDLPFWQQVAAKRYPNGLPKPYSDDTTQWLFHGHPVSATDPLQVAVARLLGYAWPAESDTSMELSDEACTWISRSKLLARHVDDDGIVCLQAVRGEQPAHERLLALLIDAWETVTPGSWSPSVLDKLLAQADNAGKGLAVWLRDSFFEQHAKRFQHRPFIWHVWDGQKDGFGALVNAHKLDAKNLERLIHTYLGDWIRTQEAGVATGADGAPLRLSAAQNLKARLQAILEGEKPYDIFVRWKPLAQQPIGWNPDLNDGIRLNIRPFMTAEVLRHNKKPKLNITWDNDRGKDVESAPWFKVFNGERINDHHLTLAEKQAVRKN